MLRQFCWPLILGLVAGSGGTAAVSQVLRKTLYGISNLDPASYGAAIVILMMVTAAAALIPARQVLRLNVSKALHYQ
jgi:ABC-type antimicrobial peptide transport system permease subunit